MSHIMRKLVFATYEQQRRRSACASSQSDQRLCYSLLRQDNICSFYMQNLKPVASSIAEEAGLSLTWSQILKTGFLVTQLLLEQETVNLLLSFFLLAAVYPHLPNGLVHPYHLDESISNFRGFWCTFSFLFYFRQIFLLASNEDLDQMLRYAVYNMASDLSIKLCTKEKLF